MDVYAVRWDEERVIKWMAVAMVLGLLGIAVMPLAVGEFEYGWVASSFGLAWSIGHGDAVGNSRWN